MTGLCASSHLLLNSLDSAQRLHRWSDARPPQAADELRPA